MTKEQEENFNRLLTQVGDLHAFVFGVQGQGGLAERVKVLEGADIDNRAFKAKVLGVATVAGLAASVLGAKLGAALSALFNKQ